jgi:hypothetical protein
VIAPHELTENEDIFEPIQAAGNVDIAIGVPYVEFAESVHSKLAPHELSSYELGKTVKKILEIESPIHQEELARRVAKVFGLEKAGNRIQEATQKALKATSDCEPNGEFWGLKEGYKKQVRSRQDVKSRTLLKAEYLPPQEILLGLQHLVKQNVQIEESELVQQTSRLFGFSRCGPDLKAVIQAIIASELDKTLINNGGCILLIK